MEKIMKTDERLSCIENKLNNITDKLSDMSYEISSLKNLIVKYEGTYKDKKLYKLRNIMVNNEILPREALQQIVDLFEEVLNDKENVENELQKLKEEAEF